MLLKDEIAAEARRLGFSLFGVTEPNTPPHYNVFERWIKQGKHGEMAYLESERARMRRKNPKLILPECKSILMLGWPHNAPDLSAKAIDESSQKMLGRIASYAWDEDYHDVIPPRLKTLVDFIQTKVGKPVPNRWYTDTGPILERELAQQAGLGWIGKNTCLINPQQGSFFLLAEIFLGIYIEPDVPFSADRCGSCTRCIQACPTDCIQLDRTIDASKCISYLTIELKGPIALDMREKIGNWVFGCDICQQVCPWNHRFAQQVDPGNVNNKRQKVELIEELALTSQEFNRKFKGSPLKRAKRRGYLRNVAVALGNSAGDSAAAQLMITLNEDPDPLIRAHAAWALCQIGGEQARLGLEKAVLKEKDPAVLAEIQIALSG